MADTKPYLAYEFDGKFIRLLPENSPAESESKRLPGELTFKLVNNIYSDVEVVGLSHIEATVMWCGLLAEMIEIHSECAGDYPYTREQFCHMLASHVQPDALHIGKTSSRLLQKETENLTKIESEY